jgi:hypothetical protein
MLPVPLELPVIELEEEMQRELITSNLCLASIHCEIWRRLLPLLTTAFRADNQISGYLSLHVLGSKNKYDICWETGVNRI